MPDFPKIYTLNIPPGIEKDGTLFSKKAWTDGLWCRFYRGKPYKIGGYIQVAQSLPEICRKTLIVPSLLSGQSEYTVFLGTASFCFYFVIDESGTVIAPLTNITPVGFAADPNNMWTFDLAPDPTIRNNGTAFIAHAAPNLVSIANNVQRPVYYTAAYLPTMLQELTALAEPPLPLPAPPPPAVTITTDGGIVTLYPYLFIYGGEGNVKWIKMDNEPPYVDGDITISGLKIVSGSATRGGNSSPAGIFWALDRLIRTTFVPGESDLEFVFDSISAETSVLSQNGWIEYDSIYYWAGIDRFLLYNGIVQELPNSSSLDFFYTNLNFSRKEKVFATKVPHWGEIWWFFPTGNNQECNHAVVYNVREQVWYNTPISRSSGDFDQTFPLPVWTDNQPGTSGGFPIWLHEVGYDKVAGPPDAPMTTAIQSYIETPIISYAAVNLDNQSSELDSWTYLYRIELDIDQTGPMNLYVNGREYARSPVVSSTYVFIPTDVKIDMREQRRLLTLRFESNVIGGSYKLGKILIVANPGDSRQ